MIAVTESNRKFEFKHVPLGIGSKISYAEIPGLFWLSLDYMDPKVVGDVQYKTDIFEDEDRVGSIRKRDSESGR